MSQLKRQDSEFQFAPQGKSANADPGIAESQPRPTLEMARAIALFESHEIRGGDPYNAVGKFAKR